MPEQLFGFYSAEAAQKFGGVMEWSGPSGPVLITAAMQEADADTYAWPDKVNRGPVEDFIRHVVPRRFSNPNMAPYMRVSRWDFGR